MAKIMNKIFNIIDKPNKRMYNKNAKRKSSAARAITKIVVAILHFEL